MTTTQAQTSVFNNVAKKDYLDLSEKGHLVYQRVTQQLKFKKEDVSKAAGVPQKSVRYDQKMPKEMEERIEEWANLLNLVAQYFDGDPQKTHLWFTVPNPMLGNISPRDMIRFGRYKKLYQFIINALENNER